MRKLPGGLMAGLAALLIAGVVAGPAAVAQDDPVTYIREDTLWRDEDSPVVIPLWVSVEEGATLAIEPGVRVETRGLWVHGGLHAEGTQARPIVFTGVDGHSWDGISLYDTAAEPPTSVIANVRIENAIWGVFMPAEPVPIEDSVFTDNRIALHVKNPHGSVSFTGNEFYSNETAFIGRTTSFIGLYENDFWDNDVSLSFDAQHPYGCGKEPGHFDVRRNDVLRGPDAPYWSHDVRASEESHRSRMVVRAPENWWGTTDHQDIVARTTGPDGCCGTSPILFDPPASSPQTRAEPPGAAGSPAYEPPIDEDDRFVVGIRSPRHRNCLPNRTHERIVGTVSGLAGRGRPARVEVALVRVRRDDLGCESYDPVTEKFSVRHSCGDRQTFSVPAPDGKWRIPLRRPLAYGKYTAAAGGNGDTTQDVIRFRVLRS